jgi:hypothetical protein
LRPNLVVVADPAETRNLAVEPTARRVLHDLRARLDLWMRRSDDPALAWRATP